MGYDISIKGKMAAADPHEVEQAQNAYQAAAKAHRARMDADREAGTFTWERYEESEKEANELHDKYSALASPEYFRLNIFGMSKYRAAMLDLEMVHESTDPASSDDWDSLPEYDDENESVYYEAKDTLTSRHGDSPIPTIPSHKLSSNDGWLVTPDEIRAALAAWEDNATDLAPETAELIQTDYWGKWISYLRLAAEHNGFLVH